MPGRTADRAGQRVLALLFMVGVAVAAFFALSAFDSAARADDRPALGAAPLKVIRDVGKPLTDRPTLRKGVVEGSPVVRKATRTPAEAASSVTKTARPPVKVKPRLKAAASTAKTPHISDAVTPVTRKVVPVTDAVAPVAKKVVPVVKAVAPVTEAVVPVVKAVVPVTEAVAPDGDLPGSVGGGVAPVRDAALLVAQPAQRVPARVVTAAPSASGPASMAGDQRRAGMATAPGGQPPPGDPQGPVNGAGAGHVRDAGGGGAPLLGTFPDRWSPQIPAAPACPPAGERSSGRTVRYSGPPS